MNELVIVEIDTNGISNSGLKVLQAAVAFAKDHEDRKIQELPIDTFCHLADLPKLSSNELGQLINEAREALVCFEVFNSDASQCNDIRAGSFLIFKLGTVDSSKVAYQINERVLTNEIVKKIHAVPEQRVIT